MVLLFLPRVYEFNHSFFLLVDNVHFFCSQKKKLTMSYIISTKLRTTEYLYMNSLHIKRKFVAVYMHHTQSSQSNKLLAGLP